MTTETNAPVQVSTVESPGLYIHVIVFSDLSYTLGEVVSENQTLGNYL